MADKITWADKESLVTDPTIAEINKVTDDNMNEIKSVTNTNADELAEKIVYDENDITENTSMIIEEVPEGSNIPYINSEIAIGSSNDSNRPVWFKQGKNLFNINSMIELVGSYRAFSTGQIVSSTTYNGFKIPIKPNTTYTITINANYSNLCYWNASFTRIGGEAFSHTGGSGTLTTPANCYYMTLAVQNNYTQVMLNEGDIAKTYEAYVNPSIYVDDTEFYSKPIILWTNSAPTSDFAGQEITLSDSISNYSYYEVIFKFVKSANYTFSTGKIPTDLYAVLVVPYGNNYRRLVTAVSNNKITFADGKFYQTYGGTEDTSNANLIPIKIVGYK